MNAKLLPLLLLLGACGVKRELTLSINSEIKPFIDQFVEESHRVGQPVVINDLIVELGDTTKIVPRAVGLCWAGNAYNSPRIMINTEYFYNAGDDYVTNVVFHELGHCVLNQGYRLNDSIMYPYVHKIFANYDYYINELFMYGKELTTAAMFAINEDSECETKNNVNYSRNKVYIIL